MLTLLAKYKLMVFAAALLGALGLGSAGVAAANGGLPVALGKRHHPAANGITHGSVITSVNGAYVTYTIDVGLVTAISSTSITLTERDGRRVTLSVNASTVWGKRHTAPKNPSRLHGKRILVFSQNGAAVQIGRGNGLLKNAVHADLIVIRHGKTREIQIDRGVVVSASATQISVKRADGVTVSEPVAAKARWIQAPRHTAIQPGQVTSGAKVAIVSYQGKVIIVRLPTTNP